VNHLVSLKGAKIVSALSLPLWSTKLLLHCCVNFSFAQIDWPYGAMVARQIPVSPPELPEGFAFGKQLSTVLEFDSQTNHEQSRNRVTISF
jgi:hypothetical protein